MKWCTGYLEHLCYDSDIGSHLFPVRSATEHGIRVVIKQQVMFQRVGQLVATGGWMTGAYAMDMRVAVPREPVEVNISTA